MTLEQQAATDPTTPVRTARFLASCAATCERLDRAPFVPLYVAAVLYAVVAASLSMRALWYDELTTYYIAKSSTLERFFSALANFDLNPPLQAALTMLTFRWFGDSNFAARIPSMLAFWVASVCLYQFVSYRLGRFYGLIAMLTLWSTTFFQYASEARPYALMIAFLGIAMVNWQRSWKTARRPLRLFGTGLGVAGILMSHVFGSLALIPLGIAEIVRSLDRRKVDWPMWAAFIAPAPCLLVCLPMLHQYGHLALVCPPQFQASLLKAITFYGEVMSGGSLALLAAVAAGLLIPQSKVASQDARCGLKKPELVLCVGLLLVPIAIDLLLMRRGGAFWPRYGIVSAIGLAVLFAHFFARAIGTNRLAAATAAGVLLTAFAIHWLVEPALQPTGNVMTKRIAFKDLDPRLPLVTASGLTFFEMNKREDDALLSRVYYLTDREAAIKYAHATIFENFDRLQHFFPIRGRVTAYNDFIKRTPRFFVLCTLDYPEDWLVPKLMSEGADVRVLGEVEQRYRDTLVVEVTPASAPQAANRKGGAF